MLFHWCSVSISFQISSESHHDLSALSLPRWLCPGVTRKHILPWLLLNPSKMSVCGEFAEHVWKPGSCKNCFHPRSAHINASANLRAHRSACGAEEEQEDENAPSPSLYSKPTIAVKPTIMNPGADETRPEFNTQQVTEFKLPAVGLVVNQMGSWSYLSPYCTELIDEIVAWLNWLFISVSRFISESFHGYLSELMSHRYND